MYKMPRNVTIHNVNLTHVADPNEPSAITITLEDGATVLDARKAIATVARGGRVNDVLYLIFAGRRLNDDDPFPNTTYAAVKFADGAGAAVNIVANGATATGGRRRRASRKGRKSTRKHRKTTRKHGGARKASRKGRKASRKGRKTTRKH
jgi:hypothetical protein